MSIIYFDNAATSWPKPAVVREALNDYFGEAGGNPGRSGHRMSIAAARIVEDARDALAELFNIANPEQLIFTKNATEALNLAIYGLVKPGDHVITTSIEHNSVMRPLRHLETNGIALSVIACASDGTLNPADIGNAIRPNTRLIVTTHGSNVAGTLMPIASVAKLAREHDIPYLVDVAQTAGIIPIDVEALNIDLMAFTGHKSLYGLTGTGGLYIRDELMLEPLTRGGTGSDSALEFQPEFLPDMYESGTLNVAGLAGLARGAEYLLEVGVSAIQTHEQVLMTRFLEDATQIAGLQVYGPADAQQRCGVVSFNIEGMVPSEVTTLLDQRYNIMSRPGLHCAPGAHHTLGTFPTGTVRFSFGYSNTLAEIEASLNALQEMVIFAQQVLPKQGGV